MVDKHTRQDSGWDKEGKRGTYHVLGCQGVPVNREDPVQKFGQFVAGQSNFSHKECAHADHMSEHP